MKKKQIVHSSFSVRKNAAINKICPMCAYSIYLLINFWYFWYFYSWPLAYEYYSHHSKKIQIAHIFKFFFPSGLVTSFSFFFFFYLHSLFSSFILLSQYYFPLFLYLLSYRDTQPESCVILRSLLNFIRFSLTTFTLSWDLHSFYFYFILFLA